MNISDLLSNAKSYNLYDVASSNSDFLSPSTKEVVCGAAADWSSLSVKFGQCIDCPNTYVISLNYYCFVWGVDGVRWLVWPYYTPPTFKLARSIMNENEIEDLTFNVRVAFELVPHVNKLRVHTFLTELEDLTSVENLPTYDR